MSLGELANNLVGLHLNDNGLNGEFCTAARRIRRENNVGPDEGALVNVGHWHSHCGRVRKVLRRPRGLRGVVFELLRGLFIIYMSHSSIA